jgi:hypothetical protein
MPIKKMKKLCSYKDDVECSAISVFIKYCMSTPIVK